ncbi:MAG: hypothetical protein JWM90_1407 [Thermoleophilia bacterium]|nr:hypothetical protein [Thermoleophilia bacterium]
MSVDDQATHVAPDEHDEALEEQPVEAITDLDAGDEEPSPELAVADSLRNALETMREESARIAALETGDEQVKSAEQFAEDAGALDAQLGSMARGDDYAR